MEILVLLFIVGILGFAAISIHNKIIRYDIKVAEALANIDVALAKRYTVVTQLFEVAKGYAKHEKEVLVKVIEIRRGMSVDEIDTKSEAVEKEFLRFNVLAEAYPELKADALFLKLQDGIRDTEEHLSAARRLYNSNVSIYNQYIESVPGTFFAKGEKAVSKEFLKFDPKFLEPVKIEL
ncbi:MAG: LemA family protein [Erysipelothrix sp.]|nr:LemA family protein [Erysipelothrix sp.]